ncbi:unnamed protein product [Polarella glacialis]|uniref:Uncharacterized protein n=1 Tax=Polarella glacialis TaxID=89957 RepID=A0A813K7H4_POLGL|nr:unnamed protein product [Polarella glacialis]
MGSSASSSFWSSGDNVRTRSLEVELRHEQDNAVKLEASLRRERHNHQRSMQQAMAAGLGALLLGGLAGAFAMRRQVSAVRSAAERLALRHEANMEQLRQRNAQDLLKAEKFGIGKFAQDILVVADNLEYASRSSGGVPSSCGCCYC